MSPRSEALRILRGRIDWGEPLEVAFADPAVADLSDRDRRLLTEIVYGVLRHLKRLDYQIEQLSSRPLNQVHPLALWILRIALYQLSFLRTPPYAVVSHAVAHVRRIGQGAAAGFVNAVLREFGRRPPPLPPGDTVEELAVRHSHPEWLVRRYREREGPELAEARLRHNNRPPDPVVWVNPLRTTVERFLADLKGEGIEAREVEGVPGAVTVRAPAFVQHSLYVRGHCFFMDQASQQVARFCRAAEASVIADLCAAPGNKSFVMASTRQAEAIHVCLDSSPSRLRAMARRARQCGVEGLHLVRADAAVGVPLAGRVDLALLDAPCSGLGTVRANPDIRWTVEIRDLAGQAERQRRMLRRALALVRPGGRVIYATCSGEPEENEEVVEAVVGSDGSATIEGDFLRSAEGRPEASAFFAAAIRRH